MYYTEQKIYPYHLDCDESITVIYQTMSLTVL